MEQETYESRRYLKLAGIITIGLLILVGIALSFIPDKLNEEYIKENFTYNVSDFTQERSEFLQYAVLTVLAPCAFIAFYMFIKKRKIKINENLEKIIDICALGACILLVLLSGTKAQRFIESVKINKNPIAILSISLMFVLSIMLYKKFDKNKMLKYISFTLIFIMILSTGYLYINHNYAYTRYDIYHIDAYFYPIYKTNCGLTPNIDFTSIYGNYPFFFNIIMGMLGVNDMFSFSIIISVLVIISLICLFIVSNKVIKNKFILLVSMSAVIFALSLFMANLKKIYVQYMPHRVIFPSIILMYMVIYLKLRNKKHKIILQEIGFLISSLACLWNLETGLIVLIVWVLFLGYEILFFGFLKDKKTYKEIAKIALMMLSSVLIYFVILNIFTYIKSKELVSIKDIIYGQSIFVGTGFYMIKMKLFHPWMLVILVYITSLFSSIKNLKFMNKDNDVKIFERNSIIFGLSVLGIGIFSYYQGRSHDEVLYLVSYPAIILIGIILDTLVFNYSNSKEQKKALKEMFIIMIIIPFVLGASNTVFGFLIDENTKTLMSNKNLDGENVLKQDIDFARKVKEIVRRCRVYLTI